MKRGWIWWMLMPWACLAQSNSKDELLLTSADSLAIFELLDSLITLESIPNYSQVALRVGYSSNINADHYAFGLDEFGATTKAAFYHKSGAFADVSGYWSNQFNSPYYLTTASIGYMNYGYKKWSFLLEYTRNFYHTDNSSSAIYNTNDNFISTAFRNSFAAAVYYQLNKVNVKVDYYLLTGDRTGHRFNPTISYSISKKKLLGLDRVSLLPTFSVLLGIEEIVEYIPLFATRLGYRLLLRRGVNPYREEKHYEFGVMNYALRMPINITHKSWGFTLSYTYNFPKPLNGEIAILENGGSLSFSAVRYLEIKPKGKKS